MSFALRHQDPAFGASTLLEALLESTEGADCGAGVFSFASYKGIRLLFDDPDFATFLEGADFELIVGVDAVTVPSALQLLADLAVEHPGLSVGAFNNRRSGVLFHPKFAWFGNDDETQLLVGSGNLTRGGLLKNWEAFGVAGLAGEDRDGLLDSWLGWREANDDNIVAVDHADVVARAQRNVGEQRRRHEEDEVEDVDGGIDASPGTAELLIAEIPRASDRWNQANFDKDSFTGFFQLQPGTYHRVVLLPVSQAGTVGQPEIRQSVDVKSRNFRIELGLAAGKAYPSGGRPIGLFLRTGTRQFRYRLLMPGDRDYAPVSAFLTAQWTGRADRMKRLTFTVAQFRAAMPTVVL